MSVKNEIIEFMKQYSRASNRDAKSIHLPRLKAIDLIAEESAVFGSKSPEDLANKMLFGMSVTITDEGEITLSD